jgi:PAS domain S-box-containing protein
MVPQLKLDSSPSYGFGEEEGLLRLLSEHFSMIPRGIVLLSIDGIILRANAAAAKLLRAALSPGSNLLDLDWVQRIRLAEALPRLAAGESVTLDAAWIADSGDAQPPVAVRADAIPLEGGQFLSLVLDDVTSELQARAEIDVGRARLKDIVEQMPGGVVVAAAPRGEIILGNAHMERILGHPLLEAPDVYAYTRYGAEHPDGRPYAPEDHPLARALAGEHLEDVEVHYRRPSGELRVLSANATPLLDARGRVDAAIVAFFDVTERWRAENDLQLLAGAGVVLTSSLNAQETIRTMVDLAVPRLADLAVVYLREDHRLVR